MIWSCNDLSEAIADAMLKGGIDGITIKIHDIDITDLDDKGFFKINLTIKASKELLIVS